MRDGKSVQTGVVSLIDNVFRTDGTKLLDRTRKRKDKHARIGQRIGGLSVIVKPGGFGEPLHGIVMGLHGLKHGISRV